MMGLACFSVVACAQDLPPLPPDIPLPPDWDPVVAQQRQELLEQQYWQRQQEIFERDFLPWLHQPMTLPNGQPYTRENEEAYRRERLLMLAEELSSRPESNLRYGLQWGLPLENLVGTENGISVYYGTCNLPAVGLSFREIALSDPAFSWGEPLRVSTVPEPGVLSLIVVGFAAVLLRPAKPNNGCRRISGSCPLGRA